jgi:hypothetical protein
MADTVSNHDLSVVTKGTDHLATTQGATDVCFNPAKVPTPFAHFVPSTQLGAGQTTKTMIVGEPIVTKAGVIEPPANSHAGTGGGVSSGTYNDNAKPTGASPDVKAEGNLVVRDTDPTTQNSANTTGSFVSPAAQARLAAEKERQKARCTIVKVEGVCAGPGDGHGRNLDFPPNAPPSGEGFYLEVLSTDTVTLTATRRNAIESGGPVCPEGVHTTWVVDRSGGGEQPRKDTFTGRDVLVLDPAWFAIPALDQLTAKAGVNDSDNLATRSQRADVNQEALANTPVTRREQLTRERMERNDPSLSQQKQNAARNRENRREADRQTLTSEQQERNSRSIANLRAATEVLQTAAKVYVYWSYLADPVTLQITELACSGSKNTTLKCFPAGKIEFDLFSEKIAENVAKIRGIASVLQRIAAIFGKRGNFEFLTGPKLRLTLEYKELTRNGNGVIKSQCNRAWELAITFEKFIFFGTEFTLPLLNFFGPMGYVANVFLNAIGIEGDAFLKLEVVINPKLAGTWNEYNEWQIGQFSVEFKLTVRIGCRARWRDIAEIHADGYVEVTVAFKDPECTKDRLIEFTCEGDMQLGVEAGGTASWWGFSKSFEVNYKPPDWKYSLGRGKVGICRPT